MRFNGNGGDHGVFKPNVALIDVGGIFMFVPRHMVDYIVKPFRAKPRPGRNERCPCGSGRKFKYCCGE